MLVVEYQPTCYASAFLVMADGTFGVAGQKNVGELNVKRGQVVFSADPAGGGLNSLI